MTQETVQYVEQLWLLPTEKGFKIGLSNSAQEELGTISFVTLPKVGKVLEAGDFLTELEAEKAVSEFSSPVAGTVVAVNEAAERNPSLLDEPDELKAWLVELETKAEK